MVILTRQLHEQFFGAQDSKFSKHPEYYTNYIKDYTYNKIEHTIENKGKSFSITLCKKCKVYFNLLELKIYNPFKLNFDEIFEFISFDIGGQEFDRIYDELYINIYNQVFKTKCIRYENDYMYIPLPFIPKEALLYNLENHDIIINCKLKIVDDLKPELYANTYDIKDDCGKTDMIIYQCQFNGSDSVGPAINHKLRLHFNHPVYLMYITGDFDYGNVEKYVLKFNGESVLEITPEQLDKKNNNLGYKFECPTFVFSDIFEGYSDTTINYSMIDNVSVFVYHKSMSKNITYKIFCLSLQAMTINHGMAGLRFSK